MTNKSNLLTCPVAELNFTSTLEILLAVEEIHLVKCSAVVPVRLVKDIRLEIYLDRCIVSNAGIEIHTIR
jgi:hypothetical protein